jgi:hypothetical protein
MGNLCRCQVCQLSARLRRLESIVYTQQLVTQADAAGAAACRKPLAPWIPPVAHSIQKIPCMSPRQSWGQETCARAVGTHTLPSLRPANRSELTC